MKIAEVDGNDPLYKVKTAKTPSRFQPLLSAIAAGASRLWRRGDVTAAGVFADLLRTLSWKLEFNMVKVYAPASSANMSVGFDVLGAAVVAGGRFAVGRYGYGWEAAASFSLNNVGRFANSCRPTRAKNIVYQCWERFCQEDRQKRAGRHDAGKSMPVGSGLGSSACSVVAALVAMNEHCGKPLNNSRLLGLMGELEGRISGSIHYDNVAPCFLGGMQLMIEKWHHQPAGAGFDEWLWVLAYPGIKGLYRGSACDPACAISSSGLYRHGRHLAGFITPAIPVSRSWRQKLMKICHCRAVSHEAAAGFNKARQAAMDIGAQACGISGSGPALFALCDKPDTAQRVADWLSKHYLQNQRLCSYLPSGHGWRTSTGITDETL